MVSKASKKVNPAPRLYSRSFRAARFRVSFEHLSPLSQMRPSAWCRVKNYSAIFFVCISVISVLTIFFLSNTAVGQSQLSIEQREAQLQSELAKTEQEIRVWQAELRGKQQESASYQRDIDILNAKIQQAQAKIKAGQITIEKLGWEIDLKRQTIEELDAKVGKGKESLSQLIRQTDEINDFTLVEILLSSEDMSGFLVDLDTFDSINNALMISFKEIRKARNQLEIENEELGGKINKETDVKKANEAERRRIETNEAEQQRLLSVSKSQERSYEQEIVEREKKVAQIRAALFSLRDVAPIPFGEALDLANAVFKKTGVRPAFLLGILTQESNLGENIGQCLVKDSATGDGIGKNTGRAFSGIMHPTRDIPPFLALASRLGFDPYNQSVSCPQPGGYGGAMGPSQFIPSTWVIYENKVGQNLGKSLVNPWDPEDAFMASGFFLADLGAGNGGYTAEREAAARYFAGSGWQSRGLGYADSVLGHAQRIQETMIDLLSF